MQKKRKQERAGNEHVCCKVGSRAAIISSADRSVNLNVCFNEWLWCVYGSGNGGGGQCCVCCQLWAKQTFIHPPSIIAPPKIASLHPAGVWVGARVDTFHVAPADTCVCCRTNQAVVLKRRPTATSCWRRSRRKGVRCLQDTRVEGRGHSALVSVISLHFPSHCHFLHFNRSPLLSAPDPSGHPPTCFFLSSSASLWFSLRHLLCCQSGFHTHTHIHIWGFKSVVDTANDMWWYDSSLNRRNCYTDTVVLPVSQVFKMTRKYCWVNKHNHDEMWKRNDVKLFFSQFSQLLSVLSSSLSTFSFVLSHSY